MASTLTPQIGSYPGDAVRGQIVQNASGALTPPKNIIQRVSGARTLYYKYRSEHLKRIQLYSQIEGLIAGNPPYNPQDLEKHGLSHIANFNNLDGRSLYERGALAYWNLLNETEYLASFTLTVPDQRKVQWANTLARNWNLVVRKWNSFYTQVNTLSAQIIKFGISPIIWPDERDWRWRTIELQRFFVSDMAQSDIEQLTAVCVETTFTAQYLYEAYLHYKDKPTESPWNIKELEALLLYRANSYVKQVPAPMDMMELQIMLQNGDIGYDALFTDSIRIVSLLYKEYHGGISHYMFDPTFDHGDFLFFANRQYQNMQEALVIFTASPGEFTIHSNRGLGHKIFSGCQAMMQLDCSIIDMARWSSTPLLKSIATGSKDIETIRFYPGIPTNIGTAEFVQNNLGANIEQLVGASRYVNQKLQYNTANSGDDPGMPDRNQGSISPSEARSRSFKEFGVLKHNIAHFYSQFDIVIHNMTAKMIHSKKGYPGYEAAKEWKDRSIEEGVPAEIFELKGAEVSELPKHMLVKASRAAGDGSTLAKIMGLETMSPAVPSFGAKGQKEYQRQLVMATMGNEYVDAFLSPEEPDDVAGGASLAGVENAVMRQGESPIFSPDNVQRSHIAVHMALGNDIIKGLQQQQSNPIEADKIFAVLIPHLEEHIQFVFQNPFEVEFMDQIKGPFKQLSDYARLNRKNAASMMQAELRKRQEDEQATQQVMSKEERENFKAVQDEKRKDIKVQSQVERAAEANKNRAEVMREKVHLDAENQRLKVQLDADTKSAKEALKETPTETIREELDSLNGVTPSPYDIEAP